MDVFDFCLNAILKESEKCQMFFNKETCSKIKNTRDEKYEHPSNRLAYLYKFGVFNIHFFKLCFLSFAKDPRFSNIIDQIAASKLICSMSIGPGTDIIGLLFAFKMLNRTFSENVAFKIINKCGAWRNSLQAFLSLKDSNFPITGKFKLLECDILKAITPKAVNILKQADVVLMDHIFESPNAAKGIIIKTLTMILKILKPNTYIILIDTNTKTSYFESLKEYGHFLYGPTEMKVDKLPCNESYVKAIDVKPIQTGKSHFGIWVKASLPEDIILAKSMFVNVVNSKQNDTIAGENDFFNLPNYSNSVATAPIFTPFLPSTPISRKCDNAPASNALISPILDLNNEDSLKFKVFRNSNNVVETAHNLTLKENKATIMNLNKCLSNLNLNEDIPVKSEDKINKEACMTRNQSIETNNDITALLKSVDSLVSKFERLVESDIIFNQVNIPSTIQLQSKNKCNHCCKCQCLCEHEYHYENPTRNPIRELNQVEIKRKHNSFDATQSQFDPHIVIPLKNINPDSVAQIIALATQNKV